MLLKVGLPKTDNANEIFSPIYYHAESAESKSDNVKCLNC